jgi:tetratricopeptide (TPR) repeat protein
MHEDDYRTATDEFWSAVAQDSTFALAWYRLSHAAGWVDNDSLESSHKSLDVARRHGQKLPRAIRQTMEAEHLARTGKWREGIELLEEVVHRDPENVLAWLQLGDLEYHYNPFLGRASADGRYALERALDLDPNLVEASQHLFRFVAREGEYARAESLAVHMRFQGYLQPGDTIALKIVSAKDSISRQRVMDAVRGTPETDLRRAVAMLSYLYEKPEMAEQEVVSLLRAHGRDNDDCLSYNSATWWLHETSFARGRVQSALSLLLARGIEWRRQMQRLASLLLYYPLSDSSLTKLETLASSANVQCSDTIVSVQSTKDFIRGLAAWRMNESGKLENAIHSLDAASDSLLPDNLEVVFGRTLRAVALWSAGQGDRALESLDSALVPISLTHHHEDFYAQSIQRFLRAEILFGEGRYDEAIDWYASVNDGPHLDNGFALFPPAAFRRAQAHDRMGETDEAIRLYTRSIEIWEVADEELQPWVTEAKESLDRLLKASAQEPL